MKNVISITQFLLTLHPHKMSSLTLRQILLTYFLWWCFWILVQAFVLQRLGFNWNTSLTDAIISNLLLSLSGYITLNTYRYYRPGTNNILQFLGWSIVLTSIYMFILRLILKKLFDGDTFYLEFFESSIPLRYTFSLLIIAFMTVISWLWFYIKEQQEITKRKDNAEKLFRDAELIQLRQQLQPHFLFNSLNSISALAGSKPQEARKMIQQLSDFLRGTLKKEDQQLVTLSDELNHLNLYLEIEKVRFGHRLNSLIEADEAVLKMKLPSLLLQPLLENAIKYGLYDTTEAVTINIRASQENKNLRIEITNPFDPVTSKQKPGEGFGLSSVQRRLYLIYGRQDLLKTETHENIFITLLSFPQWQS